MKPIKKQIKTSLPVIAQRLLGFLLPDIERQSLLGDYEELFKDIVVEKNRVIANLWYWFQIVITVPSFITGSIKWSFIMIKNYLKITIRTLLKYKGFSFINITGLALSMSICLMIIIYIKDQKNSDQFHENKDRITRIYTTDTNKGWDIDGWANTPGSVAPYLVDNYSFIEDAVRIRRMWASVQHAGNSISISGLFAEPSFFKVFSYKLKSGDPKTALNNPNSIILSEEAAFKFYGNDNPINKTLTLKNFGEFTITGVLRDLEHKSHFKFDALASFSTVPSLLAKGAFYYKNGMNSWLSFKEYYTYVLLKNEKDQGTFQDQLTAIEEALIPDSEKERFGFNLQPLLDINLGKNLTNSMPGTKHTIDVFFIPFVAMLIMFLACFNYIILSIARSLKRTREIGLRKVVGSKRSQVIWLFLSETFIITFLALVVACLFILWLIPVFNGLDVIEITKQQISLEPLNDPGIYIVFILFAIGVSLIAGLYPALYLSSIRSVNALQGVSRIKGLFHLLTRKILMGIQFAVSLVAIIFIVYYNQLNAYWMTYNKGITTDNIVNVNIQDINYETFKNEIKTNSNIIDVSFSSQLPVYGGWGFGKLRSENIDEPREINSYSINPDFINNLKINLIAGRNFSNEFSTDLQNKIIINEMLVQVFQLGLPEESIGKTLIYGEDFEVTVIGVVKDFNYSSLTNPIRPFILWNHPEKYNYANISYVPGKKEEVRSLIANVWNKFDKVNSIRYFFFDEASETMEKQVRGTVKISTWVSGFIVMIALFGLLGMATYTTEIRVKEIGIRKVLGASVSGTTYLLSKDYIKLILYSAVFAIPCGYFLTDVLMQNFAFRPGLSLWVLPAALIFILILALVTIGSQTVKAAFTNPADTLRVE